ncbi:homeobox-domain-containing protein [Backusella circina FSU 941]|nr:homeobox-domain-containing protein [Backusella circina FSU 941]
MDTDHKKKARISACIVIFESEILANTNTDNLSILHDFYFYKKYVMSECQSQIYSFRYSDFKMFTVKSLLLNSDQDQRKPRPSILNITSLLCPEPEFSDSYNQDINCVEEYQQQEKQQESQQGYQDVSSKVDLWHYNQYHNDQQMSREPYSIPYPSHRNSISSIISSPLSSRSSEYDREEESTTLRQPLKIKRRRTSSQQLVVLNNVFGRTLFPSTQVRVELARQLGMSPRTVQIWFQNKRQAMRSKQRSGSSPSHPSSMVE